MARRLLRTLGIFAVGLIVAVGVLALLINRGAPDPASLPPLATAAPAAAQPTEAPRATAMPEPTMAPAPTAAPAATEAPAPTAEPAAPVQSRGLGLTREQWEAKEGVGVDDPIMGENYRGGALNVLYQADPAGVETAWMLEWRITPSVSLEEARAASKLLIPLDAELVETYEPTEGRVVDLYMSEWLKGRFPETMKIGESDFSMWTGGEPGQFIVLYRTATGKVTSMIFGIGNNP